MPDDPNDAASLATRIAETEERLALRRSRIAESLSMVSTRARERAISPRVLLAAVAVGFLLDRVGRAASRGTTRVQVKSSSGGLGGVAAAIALALLKGMLTSEHNLPTQLARYLWRRGAERRAAPGGGSARARTRATSGSARDDDQPRRAGPPSGAAGMQDAATPTSPTTAAPAAASARGDGEPPGTVVRVAAAARDTRQSMSP